MKKKTNRIVDMCINYKGRLLTNIEKIKYISV